MKTTRLTTILTALAAWLVAGAFMACEHKELCYDHAHTAPLQVILDWSDAPDADAEEMEVCFFPDDGADLPPQRFALSRKGGTVELPYGRYRVLCLNTDTEVIKRKGTGSWDTFEVYTRDASLLEGMGSMVVSGLQPPRAEGAEGQRCTLSPDMLWTDSRTGIEVGAPAAGGAVQTVTLYPRQSVANITYEIVDVKNIDQGTAFSGSLSGLSAGLFVGTGLLDAECVSQPFAAESDGVSVLQGKLTAFGHCPDGDNGIPHKLVIYAVLKDGSQVYYIYDVTEQMHRAPDPLNIHLHLEGLPLPTPVGGDGGMTPDIDGWNDVKIDIEM